MDFYGHEKGCFDWEQSCCLVVKINFRACLGPQNISYNFFFRKRCVPRYSRFVCVCVCGVSVLCTCNLHFLVLCSPFTNCACTLFGTTSLAACGDTDGVEV
jgi:hypothetical protein